jgi:hypothetical protein
MARAFGMIWGSMWEDRNFRRLSRGAQCTYVLIRTQETVSQAGVTPIQLRWWSQSQADLTPEDLMRDIGELALCGFITVDYDADLLLIRRFIVTDGVYRKPNSFMAAAKVIPGIKSEMIKGVLCVEMRNLVAGMVEPVATPEVIDLANGLIGQLDRYAIPSLTDPEAFPDTQPRGLRIHPGSPTDAPPKGTGHVPVTPGITSSTTCTESEDQIPQTGNSTPRKPPSDTPRPEVLELCEHLAAQIEANGSRKPPVTAKWLTACRLMIDKDGRSPDAIRRAIDWCQGNDFWRGNVMSMQTLRDQYDRLRLHAQRDQGHRSGATGQRAPGTGQLAVAATATEGLDI